MQRGGVDCHSGLLVAFIVAVVLLDGSGWGAEAVEGKQVVDDVVVEAVIVEEGVVVLDVT